MEFCYSVFKQANDVLVAVCDAELLGKTFQEGELTLKVEEDFYGKNKGEMHKIMVQLKDATIGNLVGKKIIGKAIEEGLIDKESIITISGVPHVQFMKI